MTEQWWAGAYSADMEGESDGIALLTSRGDGGLEPGPVVARVPSPTFLARRGDHVYAALEGAGEVASFLVEPDGTLTEDGRSPSGGTWPCHLAFLDDALVVSNYFGGELAVISLDGAGAVVALEQVLTSSGSGPHPEQGGPHAHASFLLDAATLVSLDLGADRLLLHSVRDSRLERTGEVALPPGTGPRDIAWFGPGLLLVLGEHGRDIHVLEWREGRLTVLDRVGLPGAEDADQAAALGFGPGSAVYAGLRGSNRLAVLRVRPDGRSLEAVGHVDCGGQWPRHLVVDGDLLHVSNQNSSEIASFRLGADGWPEPIAGKAAVASPTFLLPA